MNKIRTLILAMLLAGCATTPSPATHYGAGRCWAWDRVEAEFSETKYENLCKKSVMVQGTFISCCRKKGHHGPHHSHTDRDCLAVWK